jgi:hypothetical protein
MDMHFALHVNLKKKSKSISKKVVEQLIYEPITYYQ